MRASELAMDQVSIQFVLPEIRDLIFLFLHDLAGDERASAYAERSDPDWDDEPDAPVLNDDFVPM